MTDMKSAFRIIPIRPGDYHLLGIYWRGDYYFDRCLPKGLASSCKTFETLSTAVRWIAQTKLGIRYMLHLLDDFLTISGSHEQCSRELFLFLELCFFLGIPMAPEKTVGPPTVLSFAGIVLDTVRSEARLPHGKVMRCTSMLSDYLKRKKVTLRELRSLIGLFNFACSVVPPGRAFLRRLIDLTIGISRPQNFIKLTQSAKSDMRTWLAFLSNFDGSSFFLTRDRITNPSLQLYTDASGSFGYGAVSRDQWFYGPWPESSKSLNIAVLEFYPIVLIVIIWGHLMRSQHITFFTTMRSWTMSLIRAAVGISSLCHLCEDWCLCAYKVTYYFVHGMYLVLRMAWQTLCPLYRFRDFDVSLQHTCSSLQ